MFSGVMVVVEGGSGSIAFRFAEDEDGNGVAVCLRSGGSSVVGDLTSRSSCSRLSCNNRFSDRVVYLANMSDSAFRR